MLELILREGRQFARNYIGPEHILLGLIRERDGVAARILIELGADLDRVRRQVKKSSFDNRDEESVTTGPPAMYGDAEPVANVRRTPGVRRSRIEFHSAVRPIPAGPPSSSFAAPAVPAPLIAVPLPAGANPAHSGQSQ